MDGIEKQNARNILKGCGCLIAILAVLALAMGLIGPYVETILAFVIAVPVLLGYLGLIYVLPAIIVIIILVFIINVIYSAFCGK